MSDPNYEHPFMPNRKGLCKFVLKDHRGLRMNIMSMDWEAMCKDRDVVINNFEAEIIKLRKALQQIHDSCISDSRWWNDESHAAPQDRPVTRSPMTDWWISTKRFTCWFSTDEQGVIIDAAPYLWRRRGTLLKDFIADLYYYHLVRLGGGDMTSTTDRISNTLCSFCGGYHNYSYEMCRTMPMGIHANELKKTVIFWEDQAGSFEAQLEGKDAEIAALKERIKELEESICSIKATDRSDLASGYRAYENLARKNDKIDLLTKRVKGLKALATKYRKALENIEYNCDCSTGRSIARDALKED